MKVNEGMDWFVIFYEYLQSNQTINWYLMKIFKILNRFVVS